MSELVHLKIQEDESTISFSIVEEPVVVFDCTEDGGGGIPYIGDYDVTPTFDAQTLATKNKTMTDDVTVRAIPVSRTTNPSGGKTIYIGEV